MKTQIAKFKEKLKSRPLYVEILKKILELEKEKIEVTPSAISVKLGKRISTISEPLTEMLISGILLRKSGEDKRKNIYHIKESSDFIKLLKELDNLESLKKSKLRMSSESRFIINNIENKINENIKEQLQRISNKIQLFRDYPIRTVFGEQRIDLVISSFEKVKIGIEYKLFLGEKKLRESRMDNIRKLFLKKYFTEVFGSYICTEENEIDGLLLVVVIPGIDKETKIQLENSINKMKSREFNIDILIADIKSNEFESKLILENFADGILSKVDKLKENALKILERKIEENSIKKYAWNIQSQSQILNKDLGVRPSIGIIGIGGAGNNMVSWMYKKGIKGAELIAINTDQQHLNIVEADKKLLVGIKKCGGFGCGGFIKNGISAVKENESEIIKLLQGKDMVFILAGLGGGTGSGGVQLIAEWAKKKNILTVSFVTLPFSIERARTDKALYSLEKITENSDAVFVLDNNRLSTIAGNLPIQEMFAVGNEVISTTIRGIVETLVAPNLINIEFGDLKAILTDGGLSTIGVGVSDSKNRGEEAAKSALGNPLLETNYKGATGALIHVEGGPDMSLDEINRIGEFVTENLDEDANVIWEARVSESMKGKIAVMILITGIKLPKIFSKKKKAQDSTIEIREPTITAELQGKKL